MIQKPLVVDVLWRYGTVDVHIMLAAIIYVPSPGVENKSETTKMATPKLFLLITGL